MNNRSTSLASLCLALVATACGKDSPVTSDGQTPASVAVHAGDAQQAEAGTAVAVAPAVIVRDADGQPVADVTVSFAVASGGGQVTGGSTSTSAAGIAKVSSWVLGSSGDQRLRATVGSLPAVTFQATLVGPDVQVVTIGAGGGTFEISDAEHPYNGLTFEVPQGTVASSTNWRFSLPAQPTNISLPAGVRQVGQALEIATNQARGNKLMTLEVPVSGAGPDELIFLALYDPARGVSEILPVVDRTANTVVVATSHLRGDLLLGPVPATPPGLMQPSARMNDGVARVVQLAIDDTKDVLTSLMAFSAALNSWPVEDHGSGSFPEGMGAGISALQVLGSTLDYPLFASIVKKLSIPGFYAEAGPLAALQLAQQKASAAISEAVASLSPLFNQHSKPERDALVLQNVAASARLTGRASLVGGIVSAGSNIAVAASVVSGSIGSITLKNPASAQSTSVSVSTAGLGAIKLALVANAAVQDVANVVPLSSFVLPFEELSPIASSLRRLGEAASDAAREVINQQLAVQAGMPEIEVEMQHVPGEAWAPADIASEIALVARNNAAQIRAVANGISVHRPDGSEVARTVAAALSVAEDLGMSTEPAATEVRRTISTFVESAGGAIRQVAVAQARMMLAPFEVEPDEVELQGDERTVELEASVPSPPSGGYRIEWDWGDGTITEHLSLTTASHEYASIDDYEVVATLKSSTGNRKLAVDTIKVSGEGAAWVGTVTATATHNTPDHTKVVYSSATNLRFERAADSDSITTRYKVVSGQVSAYNDVACASYTSPTVYADIASQTTNQWLHIRKTDPAGGSGSGGSSIWYNAHGSVLGVQLLNKVCITDFTPDPEAYVFQTGVIWLYTYNPSNPGALWTQSTNPNLIEGSFARTSGDVTTVWTWRFEKD